MLLTTQPRRVGDSLQRPHSQHIPRPLREQHQPNMRALVDHLEHFPPPRFELRPILKWVAERREYADDFASGFGFAVPLSQRRDKRLGFDAGAISTPDAERTGVAFGKRLGVAIVAAGVDMGAAVPGRTRMVTPLN